MFFGSMNVTDVFSLLDLRLRLNSPPYLTNDLFWSKPSPEKESSAILWLNTDERSCDFIIRSLGGKASFFLIYILFI